MGSFVWRFVYNPGGGCCMWHPPLCVGSDLVLREGVGSGGLTACEGSDGRKAAASPPWTSGPGPLLTSARGRERLVAGGIGKKNRGSCGAEPHPGLRGSRPSRPGRKTRPPAEPPGGGVRVRGGGGAPGPRRPARGRDGGVSPATGTPSGPPPPSPSAPDPAPVGTIGKAWLIR